MLYKKNLEDFYDNGVNDFINKNYTSSIENFTKAMDQGNKGYHVWVSRGAAYLQAKRLNLALDDFNHAIIMRPNNARAYHMRALAYDKKGDLDSALEDLRHAIYLNPEYGAAYRSRAMVLDKIGRSDEAVEDMKMASHLTEVNLSEDNNKSNVWQSQDLKMETDGTVSELER
jgi:tetratricopeptide (TPR) repeat protein